MCREIIRGKFLPQLTAAFDQAFGRSRSQEWILELASNDPDQQTLVFGYPSISTRSPDPHSPAYVRPIVRLELGARSEHWPAVDATVTPYVAEEFPAVFAVPDCRVRVLAAERTFWEKVTILHAWYQSQDAPPWLEPICVHGTEWGSLPGQYSHPHPLTDPGGWWISFNRAHGGRSGVCVVKV